MEAKNFEKTIEVIQKTDKDAQVRIDGSMLYLQEENHR
ncbi:hypothetical protein ATE84_4500 [Aquimarina sp. MAR_2010_214]|nr:hypothetical protein ATE84_4500 [Aquimarina sp. MAR_2010_214]